MQAPARISITSSVQEPLIPSGAPSAASPPRAAHDRILPYGFDVPPHIRASLQYIKPGLNAAPPADGAKRNRIPGKNNTLIFSSIF